MPHKYGSSIGVPRNLFDYRRTRLIPYLLCALLLLPACEERVICSGSRVESPNGACAAYYYETDFQSKKRLSQALITCEFEGRAVSGNLLSIHDEYSSPMAFDWVGDYELNILLDPESNFPGRLIGTSRTEEFLKHEVMINFLLSSEGIDADIECSEF